MIIKNTTYIRTITNTGVQPYSDPSPYGECSLLNREEDYISTTLPLIWRENASEPIWIHDMKVQEGKC